MKRSKDKDKIEKSTTATSKRNPMVIAGIVALISMVCFLPVCHNSFINWDDNAYIFENDVLSRQFAQAVSYFFQLHYVLGSYTPLTMCVYVVIANVAGIDPHVFHTVSLMLHVINVLLVFWFIYLVSERKGWVAAIVALFFGIHPMHVESVAWAAELKDVLYAAFFMAGLICYYKYLKVLPKGDIPSREHKRSAILLLAAAFGFYVLSLLSKPAAVTFPFVLLLMDFLVRRKNTLVLWIEKLPFVLCSIIISVITMHGQAGYEINRVVYTFPERLILACYAFLSYIWKLIVPTGMAIYYSYPQRVDGHLPYGYFLTPVAVGVLCYLVYRSLSYSRIVAFGFLFFAVNIALVLQVVSPGMSLMADHYTYVPYIGLLLIVAEGWDRWYSGRSEVSRPYRMPASIVLVIFIILCAFVSISREEVWRDEETMADDLVTKYPQDAVALNNKGFVLLYHYGQKDAVPYFENAIRLKTDYVPAYVNLADCLIRGGDLSRALRVTDTGLAEAPNNYRLLTRKGYIMNQQGRFAEAIKIYRLAIAAEQNDRGAYLGAADGYFQLKDYVSEIALLNEALKKMPQDPYLLNYKGYAYFMMGNYKEAERYFEQALQAKPDLEAASVNLSNCRRAMSTKPARL